MGLGSWLNRNLTYTVTDSTDPAFSAQFTVIGPPLLGPDWAAGESLYEGLMSIPGYWRGANLISDLIGQLCWEAFRVRDDAPAVKVAPTPRLLADPTPGLGTAMESIASLALDYIGHGNAIAVFSGWDATGTPTSMVPVPAWRVGVQRVGPGSSAANVLPVGSIQYMIGGQSFGVDEVLHIKGPHQPGALRGIGVLEAHFSTFQLAQELGRQARSISNHGVPSGVLEAQSPDVTITQMRESKALWLEQQRDRTIQALGPGAKFTPIAWNPTETQLIEARKFSLTEWELILGLPPGELSGDGTPMHYTSDQTADVKLLKYALNGHITRFEQEFSRHLVRGTEVRADTRVILRSSTKERYEANASAIAAGWKLKSEVREEEGLPPVAGIDDPPAAPPVAPAPPTMDPNADPNADPGSTP